MACGSNRLYHHNEFGAVSSCPCNSGIQLQFGNIAFLLLPEELDQLHAHLQEIAAEWRFEIDPEERAITIKTPIRGILFLFSRNELDLLLELTRNTRILLEVDKMLEG